MASYKPDKRRFISELSQVRDWLIQYHELPASYRGGVSLIIGKDLLNKQIHRLNSEGLHDSAKLMEPYRNSRKAVTFNHEMGDMHSTLYFPNNKVKTITGENILGRDTLVEEVSHHLFERSQEKLGRKTSGVFAEMIGVLDRLDYQKTKNPDFGEREKMEITEAYSLRRRENALRDLKKSHYYFSHKWGLILYDFLDSLKKKDEKAYRSLKESIYYGTDDWRMNFMQNGLSNLSKKYCIPIIPTVDYTSVLEKKRFNLILNELEKQ